MEPKWSPKGSQMRAKIEPKLMIWGLGFDLVRGIPRNVPGDSECIQNLAKESKMEAEFEVKLLI